MNQYHLTHEQQPQPISWNMQEAKPEQAIFTGTESECLRKFYRVCSFSWANHRKYSYTIYRLRPVSEWKGDNERE